MGKRQRGDVAAEEERQAWHFIPLDCWSDNYTSSSWFLNPIQGAGLKLLSGLETAPSPIYFGPWVGAFFHVPPLAEEKEAASNIKTSSAVEI